MSWGAPEWLWCLLGVPALVAALLFAAYGRQRRTERFGNASTVRPLIAGDAVWWRAVRGALLSLALALIVIAIASPLYGSRTRVLRKQGIDVVIALDFSKSMLAQDVHPSRIKRAKAELELLLSDLDGDRVGLVAFAGDTIEFPMTVDHSALRLFLRDLGPMDMPVGGTAIGKALIASQRLIERSSPNQGKTDERSPKRARVVVLLTDGEDHEGDAIAAAEELKAAGIKVYTVGIGSPQGQPIPMYASDGTLVGHMKTDEGRLVMTSMTDDQKETLRRIASITGGSYVSAKEGTVGITEIRGELGELQESEQKARRVTVHENRFALALLPGFLLLVLESLMPEAWLIRRRRKKT